VAVIAKEELEDKVVCRGQNLIVHDCSITKEKGMCNRPPHLSTGQARWGGFLTTNGHE